MSEIKTKKKDFDSLIRVFQQIEGEGVSSVSDEDLSLALAISYVLSKDIEKFDEVMKEEGIKRDLQSVLPEYDLKINRKEKGETSVVDTQKVYQSLSLESFLSVVTVVKSRAKTPEQIQAIDAATIKEKKEGFTLSVAKLSQKDHKELLKG